MGEGLWWGRLLWHGRSIAHVEGKRELWKGKGNAAKSGIALFFYVRKYVCFMGVGNKQTHLVVLYAKQPSSIFVNNFFNVYI